MTRVIDGWQQLSVDERIAELIRLVNTHLANAKMPPVAPNPQDTLNSGVLHVPDRPDDPRQAGDGDRAAKSRAGEGFR